MVFITEVDSIKIVKNNFELVHLPTFPLFYLGYGENKYEMSHGNFAIDKFYDSKIPLKKFSIIENTQNSLKVKFYNDEFYLTCFFRLTGDILIIDILEHSDNANRLWINVPASQGEEIFGCGEQYSYLNLRGKKVPLWVSEQGVGRNKRDLITHFANFKDDAGGDWYTTYFPQPTFLSSNNYFCLIDSYSYMEFDFSHSGYHHLEIHSIPKKILFGIKDTLFDTVKLLTKEIGTSYVFPDWIYDGVILGLQGGTDVVLPKIEKALEKGLRIAGIWIQDWEGKRVTSFGKQLMWNWVYESSMYPELPKTIERLMKNGIRTLGYINPFLALEGSLYKEASQKGLLVKRKNGTEYHVVVTTFPAALLDLTNPETREWIKNVIKKNMIGIGLSGWMADFGEYLPTDAILFDGTPAELYHNRYPVEWAKINREAVEETGKLGEIVFFMRAGNLGSGSYSTLFWHGDQMVNWSKDDGLPSVIVAAQSMSMSGLGLTHSDIGGYTTLAKNVPELIWTKRTKELFMRWAEQATFTPVMRTHEGNWPDENWQFDSDDETILHFARMSKIHVLLKPYIKHLVEMHVEHYEPIIMPLKIFFKIEDSEKFKYQYLFGRDLLVAPVIEPNVSEWEVYIPSSLSNEDSEWVHLWTGKRYTPGLYKIEAPIGYPPVFYKLNSDFSELFEEVGGML